MGIPVKVIDLQPLATMTAPELSGLLTTPESALADLSGGEWHAVVQILTASLTRQAGSLSAAELNLGVAALDLALAQGEQAGALGRNEATIRRLHLTAVLLQRRGPDPDVAFLNPRRMYDLFSEAVPLSTAQIQELPPDWRTLDIATIRSLRLVKNLVTPLLLVKSIVEQAGFADELSVWEAMLPRLP